MISMVLQLNLIQSLEKLINILYLVDNGLFCSSNSHQHTFHLFSSVWVLLLPWENVPLVTSKGSSKLVSTTQAGPGFFHQHKVWNVFIPAQSKPLLTIVFSHKSILWSDRIKQSHKHISSRIAGCAHRLHSGSLWLSVDRKINGISEPIVFLATFQLYIYTWGFLGFCGVFLFVFFSVTNCYPFPEKQVKVAMGPAPLLASPLPISDALGSVLRAHFLLTRALSAALP